MGAANDYSVVITRPEQQANQWANTLATEGFKSFRLNLLEIKPVISEEKTRAVKNKILDFDLYQKAIFVSQNAVEFGMEWLEDYWPQLPIGIEFFAVGATTAKKLSDYGIVVTDLAVSSNGGMTSEDLLRAPALQNVNGEKIIIFRGCGGRGHMADELRNRGALVDYCELYERCLPELAVAQLQQLATEISKQDCQYIMSVHSGESLENLLQLLQMDAVFTPFTKTMLRRLPLLVPSQRIATNATDAGFANIICAQNATDASMTQALRQYIQVC